MSEARSVLGVICSAYDSFFEAEKKIADYIMEHKEQAVDIDSGRTGKGPAVPVMLLCQDFAADVVLRDFRT